MRERFHLTLKELELRTEDRATFDRHNLALFDGVREVSGCGVIVDSSKHMDRLVHFAESDVLDVMPIHLIRNPHGVAYSHVKRGRDWRPYAERFAGGLVKTQQFLRDHDHVEVRYHDLVTDPPRTLMRIMEAIGLEYDPDQLNWAGRTRHNFGGNKMRHSTDSTIRKDASWRTGLSRRQKLGISLVTLPARLPGRFFYDRFQPFVHGQGLGACVPKLGRDLQKVLKRRKKRDVNAANSDV